MGTQYRIVHAQPYDADLVAIMVHRLMLEIDPQDIPRPQDILATASELMNGHADFFALLAFSGVRQPVGVLATVEGASLRATGYFGIITEFYVDPEERSKGLGEQMLYKITKFGRERHWSHLELVFPKGGQQLVGENFFHRNGFKDVGRAFCLDL